MGITTAVCTEIAKMIMGAAYTAFDNSNAHLGVGNSSTAFAAGQTDLQGASKLRKAMEASYPQRSGADLDYRSLFGTSDANFAWEEWAVFDNSTGGTMLNRKVSSLGTKTSSESWQLTVTLTVQAGS